MTIHDWLNIFKAHQDVKIFHIQHLKLLTSLNDHALRVSLSRLNKNKTVKRICRGFYANPFNSPSLEEISGQIYQPSYISLESALSLHGILSQIPQVLTCVTTQPPRTFKTAFGTVVYRQIKGFYFWGFDEQNHYHLAQKEKALADYFYLNSSGNRERQLAALDLKGVNLKRLKHYLRQMGVKKKIV